MIAARQPEPRAPRIGLGGEHAHQYQPGVLGGDQGATRRGLGASARSPRTPPRSSRGRSRVGRERREPARLDPRETRLRHRVPPVLGHLQQKLREVWVVSNAAAREIVLHLLRQQAPRLGRPRDLVLILGASPLFEEHLGLLTAQHGRPLPQQPGHERGAFAHEAGFELLAGRHFAECGKRRLVPGVAGRQRSGRERHLRGGLGRLGRWWIVTRPHRHRGLRWCGTLVERQGFHRQRLVSLAAKHRLPATYPAREFVEDGGLMAYGPSAADLPRRAAAYVDKIPKGAKPGDLPIEEPTKFELFINMKTAKALGLTIPPALLQRADQVVE